VRRDVWAHVVAACLLTGTALAAHAWVAFAAAPIALLLIGQAASIRRAVRVQASRRSVGLGMLTGLFGICLLASPHPFWALLVIAAGLGVGLTGTSLALRFDPPPRGLSSSFDPLLHAGVAADEAARLWLELRPLCRPHPEYARLAAEARVAADRNQEEGWLARPERAHPIPPPLEKPHLAPDRLAGLAGVEHLSFASEFEPQDPEIREEYMALRRNRTCHAVLVRDRRVARPTLIFVHGFGMGWAPLDARVAGVEWLHRVLGLDVAMFVLPLHGLRSEGRYSGAGLLDGPLVTNAALGQAVWDLRRLTGYLRGEGTPAVGVFGLSLGGYAAAVYASVEERLGCAVVMNAPAALDALFWRELPPLLTAAARAEGLSPHVLDHAWARHAPLRMRPRVPHGARLVIGGLADRIVPPEQVARLWEHWGEPPVHWFPGTHLLWRGRAQLRERLGSHLRATLLGSS